MMLSFIGVLAYLTIVLSYLYLLFAKLWRAGTFGTESFKQKFQKVLWVLGLIGVFQGYLWVDMLIKRAFGWDLILYNAGGGAMLLLLWVVLNVITALADDLKQASTQDVTGLHLTIQKLEADLHERDVELRHQQVALMNVLEDVTEEKRMGEGMSQSVLENIGEAIVITDQSGLVTYLNPAFERLTGYQSTDLNGTQFAEKVKLYRMSGEELPISLRSDSAAVAGKDIDDTLKLETIDDEMRGIYINAQPIVVDGEYVGVVRVIHDMTEELKIQQQKDDFFSIASHELRTPLTVIAGNVDMLLSGYGESTLADEDRELLEDTNEATQRLIRMVNSFLHVSRLDQGRLKVAKETIELCSLIDDVVGEMQVLSNEKSISLESTCEAHIHTVVGDSDKVREVLVNLIGNAMKFTKEGGIELSHRIDESTQQAVISVKDTGIGIATDKQDLLFQRFQQAMNRTLAREAGGTGLGLYISREFVRKMGGELWLVSSEEGKGSEFAFTLPIEG